MAEIGKASHLLYDLKATLENPFDFKASADLSPCL
jgi:hypothetical protein